MAEQHATDTEIKQPPAPEALSKLKAGNSRYVAAHHTEYDFAEQRKKGETGQWPYAAIISCMDSRTSAEIVFDLGLGDIFSIRNAGNVVTDAALGSLEYAVGAVGVKLVVVMGHTSCGAAKGACGNYKEGLKDFTNLTGVLDTFSAAKEAAKDVSGAHDDSNADYVKEVTHQNAILGAQSILKRSDLIRKRVEESNGNIGIIPAVYDIATGEVTFFEEHATFGAQGNASSAGVNAGAQAA